MALSMSPSPSSSPAPEAGEDALQLVGQRVEHATGKGTTRRSAPRGRHGRGEIGQTALRMPGRPDTLRFGAFMAPYHAVGEGPTLALERDLELIVRLDELGFDEVWVGEHHSTGWETIASPEIFLAVAAERTRRIRLGTGAISLPYHHPLMVADRIVLLDHLTRGRVMLGVGPGGHITDALMLGIEPTRLRPMMDEALGVIVRLLTDTAPLTVESDWFRLHDAVLQLRPYQRPHPPLAVTSLESPAGMALAGRHGAGVLSLAVTTTPDGPVDLPAQWARDRGGRRRGRDRGAPRRLAPVRAHPPRRDAAAGARRGPRGRRALPARLRRRARPAGRRRCPGRPSGSSTRWSSAGAGWSARPTTARPPSSGSRSGPAASARCWSGPTSGRPARPRCAATSCWRAR